MNEKDEQMKRAADFIVKRGFATGYILNDNERVFHMHFTEQGYTFKVLLQSFFDVEDGTISATEVMQIINFLLKAR